MKTLNLHSLAPCQLAMAALIVTLAMTAGCSTTEAQDAAKIAALSKKPSPLSQADQEALAKAVFATLARADGSAEPEFFERHYKMVMDKCPDTDLAHESYWRLTNLYRQAYDEPKLEEIIKILEQFLTRYKTSTVVSMEKYPDELLVFSPIGSLHRCYEELDQHDKIAAYYDKMASQEASFATQEYLDYATALDETGRTTDAIGWYEKYLKKSEGEDDVEFGRLIAQDRLTELKEN